MEPKQGDVVPQNPTTAETVTISKAEFDDIRHKADVSSQNFERLKKAEKDLEEAKVLLENNNVPSDPEDDKVGKLQAQVDDLQKKQAVSEVIEKYPILKDKLEDLEAFRELPENKGMNLKTAAKAFVVEKGLLEPQRQGLERPTGGPRTPVASGMTADDVANLRNTNFKKYLEMVRNGEIKIK